MAEDPDTTIEAAEEAGNPLVHLVYSYGRPYWRQYAVGLGFETLGLLPSRLQPLIVGVALDALFIGSLPYRIPLVPPDWIPRTSMAQFWFTAVLLGVLFLTSTVISVVSGLAYGWFQQALLHDVRTDTYDAMQRLRLGFFDDQQTGQVMSVLNNDVENLQSFTDDTIGNIVRFPLSVLVAFAFMALLNFGLAMVLLVVPVVIAGLAFWFSRAARPRHEALRESVGALNARFENNIGGIDAVKAYTGEEREFERVVDASREMFGYRMALTRVHSVIKPSLDLVQNLAIAAVILIGGYWILVARPPLLAGTVTAGTLFTFVVYVRGFVYPMRQLEGIVNSYEAAKASSERIVGLLADPDVIPEADDAHELADVEGRVEYDDVSFGYDGTDGWTVRDVSFAVDPGQTVGIVGQTGAGKSTLVKLLFRFYEVDEGAVRVDGRDVRDVTIRSLRRHLGYVSQDPFLFYGTVRENIAHGHPDADHDAVVAAAERAGAARFVEALPDGYDTVIGERGVKLSGGQRQRLSLARALFREPSIIVLDEATSHVDNETEAAIQRSLDALGRNVTTLVIAHRLSTVRGADLILVLDDGELVERGSHDALLEADGLYANLWRVQVGDVATLPEAFVEEVRSRQLEGPG